MHPTVVFRIDAGVEYGWGHLMRGLALAQELRQLGARVVWVGSYGTGGPLGYLERHGYEVLGLPRPVSSEQDAELTAAALRQAGIAPDWLIVDHYDLAWKWEARVRHLARRILAVDDVPGRRHRCDLLLDQTAPAQATALPREAGVLRGPAYALVRREFRALRQRAMRRRNTRRGKVEHLLISFGAVDHLNLTSAALAGVAQSGFRGVVDVVMSEVAPHREEVLRRALETTCVVRFVTGLDNLAPLMFDADLAIGSGGMTAWERCVLGLPTLLVTAAENQRRAAATLRRAGAVDFLGAAEHLQPRAVAERIGYYSRRPDKLIDMALRAATLCDGLGAARVALHIVPERARDGTPVTLRPATPADADLVYGWQRIPRIRRYARNPQAPHYGEHKRWFSRKLRDPDCVFQIVEYGSRAVGVVRLDLVEEPSTYEVSVLVEPAVQGRGIGAAALTCMRRLLPQAVFVAYILPENTASRTLFEKAGYVFDARRQMFVSVPQGEGSDIQ